MYVFKTPKTRRAALEMSGAVVPAAQAARQRHYEDVDVAIVMESTYPYLKGGVSAVVHDIVTHNPDLTYGIIHITWDAGSPQEDLYGMPDNVAWVRPVFLSLQEHRHDYMAATSRDLGMTPAERAALVGRLFDALYALSERRDVEPLWQLIDEGLNERTRTYPLWALLGTKEFMEALAVRMPSSTCPWRTPSGCCGTSSPSPTPFSERPCRKPGSITRTRRAMRHCWVPRPPATTTPRSC